MKGTIFISGNYMADFGLKPEAEPSEPFRSVYTRLLVCQIPRTNVDGVARSVAHVQIRRLAEAITAGLHEAACMPNAEKGRGGGHVLLSTSKSIVTQKEQQHAFHSKIAINHTTVETKNITKRQKKGSNSSGHHPGNSTNHKDVNRKHSHQQQQRLHHRRSQQRQPCQQPSQQQPAGDQRTSECQ